MEALFSLVWDVAVLVFIFGVVYVGAKSYAKKPRFMNVLREQSDDLTSNSSSNAAEEGSKEMNLVWSSREPQVKVVLSLGEENREYFDTISQLYETLGELEDNEEDTREKIAAKQQEIDRLGDLLTETEAKRDSIAAAIEKLEEITPEPEES